MALFDPMHVFHQHMIAAQEGFRINSGEKPEPGFTMREATLLHTLVKISAENLTKPQMQREAQFAIDVWRKQLSPELHALLGFGEKD